MACSRKSEGCPTGDVSAGAEVLPATCCSDAPVERQITRRNRIGPCVSGFCPSPVVSQHRGELARNVAAKLRRELGPQVPKCSLEVDDGSGPMLRLQGVVG